MDAAMDIIFHGLGFFLLLVFIFGGMLGGGMLLALILDELRRALR